jgi:dihydrofolate reductase
MRRLRYNVAVSLDGFIAGLDGDYDWILPDPDIDREVMPALFAEFDTFVMGRKTYETIRAQGDANPLLGQSLVVASTTLTEPDRPNIRFVAENIVEAVADLKRQPGKDIWLFGGGHFARTLFDANLVDTVEASVMPILLTEGLPLLPPGARVKLTLESVRSFKSGIQMLSYAVSRDR